MASYTKCKVGEVMSVTLSGHETGYGFGILSENGRPLCSLAFVARADAAEAREAVAKAVAKAAEITPGS